MQSYALLMQVADALNSLRLSFCAGWRRQQKRGEDSDDRDDDQQLHQRETGRVRARPVPLEPLAVSSHAHIIP